MEEQAQKALAELLERAISGIDSAVAFSQAQIPEVVEQLLIWEAISSLLGCLWAILLGAGIAAYWWVAIPVIRSETEKDFLSQRDSRTMIPAMVGFGITGFGVMWVASAWSMDWLQIWVAPKLYLLEYAADLAK